MWATLEGILPPSDQDFAEALAGARGLRDDLFLQDAILGPTLVPMAHLLVPTWLCTVLDDTRATPLDRVSARMDRCFRKCAACGRVLRERRMPAYQVALRVLVGAEGPDDESDAWCYEIVPALLCGGCQTRPRFELVLLERPDAYGMPVRRVLHDAAFSDTVSMRPFYRDEDRFRGEGMAYLCHAVARNYLHRLSRLAGPEAGGAAWRALVRWRRDGQCDHCMHATLEPVTCPDCGVAQWCSEDCCLSASVYHPPQCETLSRGRVLDAGAGWFMALYDQRNPFFPLRLLQKEDAPPI